MSRRGNAPAKRQPARSPQRGGPARAAVGRAGGTQPVEGKRRAGSAACPANERETLAAERARLMERMRAEVARELGLYEYLAGDLGRATTAQCGKFGALLRQRADELLRRDRGSEKPSK
ncbi:small, acid-soluble spore protein, alpha/beta type [Alicyclobacillus shizuokensis]|uniref:small, acid-soluble spore protein, alpha/beta type n=1 Tax=Alicyclobacillus shizuokensis TaxID=392014 RepID=UPI00082D99F6|nr:small, acid-soluble spore protein, alpha/beta type [Alicyclobacillus shizuokensis]MCL6625203.1 alpha/beta-type small acid-soluble spore protein [Alicyclobacillus shizuokensis]